MTINFRAKHVSGGVVDVLEPFNFPAGEAHIKGFDSLDLREYAYHIADVRGHNAQDLFHLALWREGLYNRAEEQGLVDLDGRVYIVPTYVIMPYLPAARADRGTPFGAFSYAEFLAQCVCPTAIVGIDPHSPVMPSLLDNYTAFPFERIIKREIQDRTSDIKAQRYVGVIAPDKGAHDRAAAAARVMGVPVYTAGKTRDFETGKLTGFHMEDELPTTGHFLVVDDIGDGGGTFIGLAEAIRAVTPHVGLDLWVTHGVFSNAQGLIPLYNAFEIIHTTDSYFGADLQVAKGLMVDLAAAEDLTNAGPISEHFLVHNLTPYLYTEVQNLFQETETEN